MTRDARFSQLFAFAREGDRAAFDVLLQAHEERLRRFIASRMGQDVRRRAEADDVYQECALDLFRRIARFPSDLSEPEFRVFLYEVARRRIADVLRRARDRGWSEAPSEALPPGPRETGTVTRADDRRLARAFVDRLPPAYRTVTRCCLLEGHGIAEAARILGIQEEAARKRLYRARRLLEAMASRAAHAGGSAPAEGEGPGS